MTGNIPDSPYNGKELDNGRSLLKEKGKGFDATVDYFTFWAIHWKMRTHCNHYEVI